MKALLWFVCTLFVLAPAAQAQPPDAALLLHVEPYAGGRVSPCAAVEDPKWIPCADYVTSGDVRQPYWVYVVGLLQAPRGLAGAEFGVAYNGTAGFGVDVQQWFRCGDLEFPGNGFPASGGGTIITFDRVNNCQVGGADGGTTTVFGAFYVYAYTDDLLRITPRDYVPVPALKLGDCDAVEYLLWPPVAAGAASFSFGATIPGVNPCESDAPADTTPPTLVSAFGYGGADQVSVTFNEPITIASRDPANFRVLPGSAGRPEYGVLAVGGSGTGAILVLDDALDFSHAYTVIVNGVADPAGNVIAPDAAIGFATGAEPPPDAIPPVLVSAVGVAGSAEVMLNFSEPVLDGASTASNFSVLPGRNGAPEFTILTAEQPTPATVRLSLNAPLASATGYTARVKDVADLAGNTIAPGAAASFVTPSAETSPPLLLSAEAEPGETTIHLHFSEPLGFGAGVRWNYGVWSQNPSPEPRVILSVIAGASDVELRMAEAIAYETTYRITVSGVYDLAGNAIAPGTEILVITPGAPDVTPPALLSAAGTGGTTQILLQFSESVATGANDPANYRVSPGPDGAAEFPVVSAAVNAAMVALTLDGTLAFQTQYTVTVSNVADPAGNVIAPNSSRSFTTGADPVDRIPPTPVSASGWTGGDHIAVRFSEPVGAGATTAANYRVTPGPNGAAEFPIGSVIQTDPAWVSIRLLGTLRAGTTYTVAVSNVEDLSGNAIAPGSQVSFQTINRSLSRPLIALSLRPHTLKATQRCTTNVPTVYCEDFLTRGSLGVSYDLYVVIIDPGTSGGIGGAAFGIAYPPSVGVFDWTKCSDLEFPGQSWPASGGGNTLTWDTTNNCQSFDAGDGVRAIGGSFYVYAYAAGDFDITRRNVANPDLKVADCLGVEYNLDYPYDVGRAGFVWNGYNPCTEQPPTNVEPTTWGAIKRTYGIVNGGGK